MELPVYLQAQRLDFYQCIIKTFNTLFQTLDVAKSYYSCEDMEGVALENEGSSITLRYVPLHCICFNDYVYVVLIGKKGH